MNEKKRCRGSNYTPEEKALLLNLVESHKNVIENKTTNAALWRQKEETWKHIEKEFNRSCPSMTSRTVDSLKKCYDNIKNDVRKQVAEKRRRHSYETGGGPCPSVAAANPLAELTLSIIKEKSVCGLNNKDSIRDSVEELEESIEMQLAEPLEMITGPIPSISNIPQNRQRTESRRERRRPAAAALQSSQLAKQYGELAEAKLELIKIQIETIKEDANRKRAMEEEEFAIRKEILLTELKIKQKQLQKLCDF